MRIGMIALKRSKTGDWIVRKIIPKDARAEFKRLPRREQVQKPSLGSGWLRPKLRSSE